MEARFLNLMQIQFVLIPKFIPQIPIPLLKLFLFPTFTLPDVNILTILLWTSVFVVLPLSFSTSLTQLQVAPNLYTFEAAHFKGCQVISISLVLLIWFNIVELISWYLRKFNTFKMFVLSVFVFILCNASL